MLNIEQMDRKIKNVLLKLYHSSRQDFVTRGKLSNKKKQFIIEIVFSELQSVIVFVSPCSSDNIL